MVEPQSGQPSNPFLEPQTAPMSKDVRCFRDSVGYTHSRIAPGETPHGIRPRDSVPKQEHSELPTPSVPRLAPSNSISPGREALPTDEAAPASHGHCHFRCYRASASHTVLGARARMRSPPGATVAWMRAGWPSPPSARRRRPLRAGRGASLADPTSRVVRARSARTGAAARARTRGRVRPGAALPSQAAADGAAGRTSTSGPRAKADTCTLRGRRCSQRCPGHHSRVM